jgi:hypothetical protein
MGLRITMAGQDITGYVDEGSLYIQDVLGQGAGAGAIKTGKTATMDFVTSLPQPAFAAGGAGTPVNTPTLVRMGEVVVYDAHNNAVYGGYAGKLSDVTDKKQVYTKVECYDYFQHLARIFTTTNVYDGVSDIFIIRDLIHSFAPWVDLSLLPTTGSYTFFNRKLQHMSVQEALMRVAGVVGYQIWIDNYKRLHYENPDASSTAPFALSDQPNFITSFPWQPTDPEIDDTAAVNRVFFYGGKHPSNDFTQDISTQANGHNTLFVLAYYPHKPVGNGGNFLCLVNGSAKTIGFALGTGVKNTFKSQGGICDVLLNTDAQTLSFDPANPPAAGASVSFMYRYELPLQVVVKDQASITYYGQVLDAIITDQSVFDQNTAVHRCKTLLTQQSFGLRTIKFNVWKAGLYAGQIIRLDNTPRGIHNSFLIQEVDTYPLGAGNFRYEVTVGAWNWSVVHLLSALTQANALVDTGDNNTDTPVDNESAGEKLKVTWTLVKAATFQMGNFFPEASPVGDGTDGFPGLFSI